MTWLQEKTPATVIFFCCKENPLQQLVVRSYRLSGVFSDNKVDVTWLQEKTLFNGMAIFSFDPLLSRIIAEAKAGSSLCFDFDLLLL